MARGLPPPPCCRACAHPPPWLTSAPHSALHQRVTPPVCKSTSGGSRKPRSVRRCAARLQRRMTCTFTAPPPLPASCTFFAVAMVVRWSKACSSLRLRFMPRAAWELARLRFVVRIPAPNLAPGSPSKPPWCSDFSTKASRGEGVSYSFPSFSAVRGRQGLHHGDPPAQEEAG